MKRITLIITTLLMFATYVYSDICSDVTNNFVQRMNILRNDTNAVLSNTSDPSEIAAIQQSYQIQLTQLQSEMQSTLNSLGCLNQTTPPPSQPPVTPPTTEPPVTPPANEPPVTPPQPPETPPQPPTITPEPPGTVTPPEIDPPACDDEDDDDGDETKDCRELLINFAQQLKSQGVKGHELVRQIRAESNRLGCGFNKGQSVRNLIGHKKHCGKKHCNKRHHNCDKNHNKAPKDCRDKD